MGEERELGSGSCCLDDTSWKRPCKAIRVAKVVYNNCIGKIKSE